MVTLGIDLAAQAKRTAACLIEWDEVVTVHEPVVDLTDPALLRLIGRADCTGIDIPLGWPTKFVQALSRHHAGDQWPLGEIDESFTKRATDRFVRAMLGVVPLSVASDKIAIPAMRAARLLGALPVRLDRSGAGKVVEVYPAAALKSWGFAHQGYKSRKGAVVRKTLVNAFLTETSTWVRIAPSVLSAFVRDDNCFDAFIAALVARAWATQQCLPIPETDVEAARVEGWIALPLGASLSTLAHPPAGERRGH